MDPSLYQKALEHNEEGRRIKKWLAQLCITVSPFLLVFGLMMFLYPAKFRSHFGQGIMGDFWFDKMASALIIFSLYFPYLSIRWLVKNRKVPSA
jgi:hypothetical protein